jgi:aliphatic nitrilase
MVWGRGDGRDLQVFDTDLGVVGGLICYEHGNALFRYAIQAQREEIHVAVWPGGMASINGVIDAAIRSYAFEASNFVLNATSILTEEILEALGSGGSVSKLQAGGGHSAIVAPRGVYLAGPEDSGDETILYADLEPERIVDAKLVVDCAGHYARPDVVRLQLRKTGGGPLDVIEE